MTNPYSNLPPERFWKSGVSEQHPCSIEGLYRKKFSIGRGTAIATAGSCFAQHIGTHLRRQGYRVLDVEPAPPGMSEATAKNHGYGIYSARYGNLYTARQLLQLTKAALGLEQPKEIVWTKGGRYFDALRPAVEPCGFATADEVIFHRQRHLERVRTMIETMNLFIFTLGLTEAWIHKASGTAYPTAPGVVAGDYDPDIYELKNFTHRETLIDMLDFRRLVKSVNGKVKFLLTVSPVPLTATATDRHVLLATTYSKSVLRAVAGEIESRFADVDYFPSYELIASPFSRGFFYSPNLRSVETEGVNAVMRVFFSAHKPAARAVRAQPEPASPATADDVVCEEVMLEAFAK